MVQIRLTTLATGSFALWLHEYKNKNQLSNAALAQLFDISESSIQHILSGYRRASEKIMEKVFTRLNLNPRTELEQFIETDENGFSYLVSNRLNDDAGTPVLTSNISNSFPLVKVPVFDAGAGELTAFILNWRDYEINEDGDFVYVTPREKKLGAFGIKVNGDSMAPTIEIGDIVICMPTRAIDNGKVVLACWPGSEADPGKRMIKRYKVDDKGNVLLWSDNPIHEPIALSKKEMREIHLCRVTKLVKEL